MSKMSHCDLSGKEAPPHDQQVSTPSWPAGFHPLMASRFPPTQLQLLLFVFLTARLHR